MGWLTRKLSEIKELREIENAAYEEEKQKVEEENKKYRIQQAKAVGHERANKKLESNRYNKKVEKAIDRGKEKARVTPDNNHDTESKIMEMWGLKK